MNFSKRFANDGDIVYDILQEKYFPAIPNEKLTPTSSEAGSCEENLPPLFNIACADELTEDSFSSNIPSTRKSEHSTEESVSSDLVKKLLKQDVSSDDGKAGSLESSGEREEREIKLRCTQKFYGIEEARKRECERRRLIRTRVKFKPAKFKDFLVDEYFIKHMDELAGESTSVTSASSAVSKYIKELSKAHEQDVSEKESIESKVDYSVSYLDSDIEKEKKKKSRKKLFGRDPEFDRQLYNTEWPCELSEDEKSSQDAQSEIEESSSNLTPQPPKICKCDKISNAKIISKEKQIKRAEKFVGVLQRHKGVKDVIILVDRLVLFTTIQKKSLLAFYIQHFYFLCEGQLERFKEIDEEDEIIAIQFETNKYDIIVGLGTGGPNQELFSIMAILSPTEDEIPEKPHEFQFNETDETNDFPKVWLKGFEREPETMYAKRLRKYREELGMDNEQEEETSEEDEIKPFIKTDGYPLDSCWRRPLRSPSPTTKEIIDNACTFKPGENLPEGRLE